MRKPRPLRSRAGNGRAGLRRTPRKLGEGRRARGPRISSARDPHSANRSPRKEFPRRSPALEEIRRTLRFLRRGFPRPGFVKTAGCEHQRYSVRLADLIPARFMLYWGITDGSPRIFYDAPSDVLFIRRPLRRRMCQHRCKNYTSNIIPLSAREVNMSGDIVPPNSAPRDRIF